MQIFEHCIYHSAVGTFKGLFINLKGNFNTSDIYILEVICDTLTSCVTCTISLIRNIHENAKFEELVILKNEVTKMFEFVASSKFICTYIWYLYLSNS